MYEPKFNSVLIQIDDKDAEWGGENNEAMLGKSYSKGTVVDYGIRMSTQAYPAIPEAADLPLKGKEVLWNEGAEAGTTFEYDGKLHGFIYWWDIRGVKSD